MNFRSRLVNLADDLGATRALLRWRQSFHADWLTVVTWHRVDDSGSADDVDDGVLDATPAEFQGQVEILARHFTVLTLAEVRHGLANGGLPKNSALLTFDDGYLDSHDKALPILSKAGVPATFFIATDSITRRVPFWWDSVAWIVKHAKRRRFAIEYPKAVSFDLDTAEQGEVIRKCLDVVKHSRGLDVDRYLDGLGAAAEAPWGAGDKRRLADRLLMTWDQVRALDRAGMDVASHTRTHRVLDTVPEPELDRELAGARDDLTREIGRTPFAIAYPVGRPVVHVPAIRAAIERAGYALGFTYLTGYQPLAGEPIDHLAIRRIAVDRATTRARFRARLATFDRVL